jgi:DNA polymerase-3 subunit beta
MKIECVKDKLAKALSKSEKITVKNGTLPILSCFLLKAEKDSMTITSTNLDVGLEIKIAVKVLEEGTVAVPAQIFSNFISNIFNDKNITLETDGTLVKVSTDHTHANIKTVSIEDFPIIPKVSKNQQCTISTQDFLKGLKSVFYAASQSTIKPALSSIYIYSDDESLIFVATDSFRLAEKRVKLKKQIDIKPVLLPLKNVSEIIRVFEDVQDDMVLTLDTNQISFEYNGIYMTSRVVDAVFPDYKQIIPKDFKTESIVLKYDLINNLKMSNVFADKFSQIYVTLSEKPKLFEIKTKNADVGENVSQLDSVVKGENVSMSFNYKYIIDCFQSIEADSISIQCTDSSKPMVVRGVGDKSYLYLVMPMNK